MGQVVKDGEKSLRELKAAIMREKPLPVTTGEVESPEVVEVFSPPRIGRAFHQLEGVVNTISLDLRRADADGRRCEFDDPTREKVRWT